MQGFLAVDCFVTQDTEFAHEYLFENVSVHVDVINYENLSTFTSSGKIQEQLMVLPRLQLPRALVIQFSS